MTAVRLIYYVTDPFLDARQPIAALVATGAGVTLVRAPLLDLPPAARANAERALIDLAADALDPLPLGAGAQVIGGEVLSAPVPMHDATAWARRALSERAA